MRPWSRIALCAGLGAVVLLLLPILVVFAASVLAPRDGQIRTPSGLIQDRALYIRAHDGTRLAVDVWLPADYRAGQRLPAVLQSTRYWRAINWSWIADGLSALGLFHEFMPGFDVHPFVRNGYAVVVMDTRGSGASEGSSRILFSPDEVRDLDDVAHWIVRQPWSDGRIGSAGISYNGHLAEFTATLKNPAIKSVALLYTFFDLPADGYLPGGVRADAFLNSWSLFVAILDSNDICVKFGFHCRITYGLLIRGVKPVDEDRDGRELAQIVARRHDALPSVAMRNLRFRDDVYGTSGLTLAQRSPYVQRAAVEDSRVPMMVVNGWLDCMNVNGALSRYLTFSNDQILMIGAWTHAGGSDSDPFAPPARPPVPSPRERWKEVVHFFDQTLKPDHPSPIGRGILYTTLGAGTGFRETATWPPAGLVGRTLFLAADHRLHAAKPAPVTLRYTVDPSTTTGDHNRWRIGIVASDVVYPDRAAEDRKLLSFTSDPFPADTEITGTPVLHLSVASSREDNAFFAYLEDVAPSGRVTYITEGILRGVDRKVSASPPYTPLGPFHSLLRADAERMIPGQMTKLEIPLASISVLIREGHSLRVALAGADTPTFERIPSSGDPPVWLVQTGESSLSFAARPWRR